MNITIDSNILFSAIIKDSLTRKLILEYDGLFLFPSYIFEEMEKHKELLLKKSGMNEKEFNELMGLILKKVAIVQEEVLLKYRQEALEIIRGIDESDVVFIACALAHDNSILWSNEKRLKNQSRVKVMSTNEISKILST